MIYVYVCSYSGISCMMYVCMFLFWLLWSFLNISVCIFGARSRHTIQLNWIQIGLVVKWHVLCFTVVFFVNLAILILNVMQLFVVDLYLPKLIQQDIVVATVDWNVHSL